jgi:outer membrane protein TolC
VCHPYLNEIYNADSVIDFLSNNFNNFNSYGYGIMPSYTLNVFEQIKQGEIATLNLAMQQQAVYAVRLGIISQVSSSYFALLGFHRQLEIQEETLRDAEELRKLTLIQYEKGSISDLKVSYVFQSIGIHSIHII